MAHAGHGAGVWLWTQLGVPADPDMVSAPQVEAVLVGQRRLLLRFFDEHV